MAEAAVASGSSTSMLNLLKYNGKSFHLWKRTMLAYLMSKKLSKAVELVIPDLDAEEAKQEDVNARNQLLEKAQEAYTILWMSLNENIKVLFLHVKMGDAHGLWKSLLSKYESKTVANKLHIRNQLLNCKMQSNEEFEDYLARINKRVSELESMGSMVQPDELCCMVLNGLPSEYEPLVQALEINGQLDCDSLCQHVMEYQEKLKLRQQGYGLGEDEGMANYVNHQRKNYYKPNQTGSHSNQYQGANGLTTEITRMEIIQVETIQAEPIIDQGVIMKKRNMGILHAGIVESKVTELDPVGVTQIIQSLKEIHRTTARELDSIPKKNHKLGKKKAMPVNGD